MHGEADLTVPALAMAAVAFGFLHTAVSPAHYLPFIALSAANGWGRFQTLKATFVCGLGHALSSTAVGAVGLALGAGVAHMNALEESREAAVNWMFLAFAVSYTLYGLRAAFSEKYGHAACAHAGHDVSAHAKNFGATFWMLFLLFTLGPCEILIPLIMKPAAEFDWIGVALIAFGFSASTILTMLAMVWLLLMGVRILPEKSLDGLEKYSHLAGGIILLICSAAMFLMH